MFRVQDIEWPGSQRLTVSEVDALYINPLTSQFIEALSPEGARGVELNIYNSTIPFNRKSKPVFATYYGSRKLDSGVALTYLRVPVDTKGTTLRKERGNKKRLGLTRKGEIRGASQNRTHRVVRGS
jgi:hypothetical protein